MTKFLTVLAASLLLAGCTSMAPTYERPAAPVAQQWPVAQATTADANAADIGWREFFTDTRLQGLIEQALANNRDLRVAVLNVQRAQAQYGVQQADRLPTVNAAAGQTATRSPGGSISRQYSATLGVSAWELDLFGRVKSLNDAALQQYLATDDARRSAQISLVAQVAGGWLTLAADQERLRLAEQTLLAVPALAVRLMRGKKAARAAPMLALAACSVRSACCTSGRVSSTSLGMPADSAAVCVTAASVPATGSCCGCSGWPTSSSSALRSWATAVV